MLAGARDLLIRGGETALQVVAAAARDRAHARALSADRPVIKSAAERCIARSPRP